jgi:putative hydrolase of the HAD superfamily
MTGRQMDPGRFRGCEAILFDFGGTLDSDGEHWLDRFYALYEQVMLNIPAPEIKRVFYHADSFCSSDPQVMPLGLRPLMRKHVHCQFTALNLEDEKKEMEVVDAFCTKSEYFLRRNGDLLLRLRNRYQLGLVSNFYGNVRTLCEEAGFADILDVIFDSVLVGMSKPDSKIFLAALAKLALPAEKVIFIGDSYERDMIPARALGMKTLWLKGPNPRIPENAGPVDGSISSLSELEELLS